MFLTVGKYFAYDTENISIYNQLKSFAKAKCGVLIFKMAAIADDSNDWMSRSVSLAKIKLKNQLKSSYFQFRIFLLADFNFRFVASKTLEYDRFQRIY